MITADRMLAAIVRLVLKWSSERISMISAGSSGMNPIRKLSMNSVVSPVSIVFPVTDRKLITQYAANESMNGITDVLTIPGILLLTSVFVRSATSSALVDTGEHLSPKNTPERIAPPASIGFIPIASDIVMHMTPTVAALPNDVPVRKDMSELTMNTAPRNHSGWIMGMA